MTEDLQYVVLDTDSILVQDEGWTFGQLPYDTNYKYRRDLLYVVI